MRASHQLLIVRAEKLEMDWRAIVEREGWLGLAIKLDDEERRARLREERRAGS